MVTKRSFSLLVNLISALDPDPNPLDPQDFGFLDPDSRGKISTKNYKKKPFFS